MRKNKRLVVLSLIAVAGSLYLANTRTNAPVLSGTKIQTIKKAVSSEASFSTVGNASYAYADGAITLSSNTTKNQGFYLTSSYDSYGDYTVSSTFAGTQDFPISKEMDIGIVPWYIDSDNYVLIYMNWSNSDRPTQLREIQITGRVGGKNLIISNGSGGWTSKQWNDVWTDGNVTKACSTNTLSVSKKRTDDGKADVFTVSLNGNQMTSLTIRDTVRFDYKRAKIGVYGYNDTITFSDFAFASDSSTGKYEEFDDGVLKSTDTVTKGEDNYSITAASSGSKTYYLKSNPNIASGYQIDLNLAGSNATDLSAIAYYENEYNYLRAGVKNDNGTLKVGFNGFITNGITTTLSQTIIDDYVTLSGVSSINDITSLKVTKSGSVFSIYVNGTLAHKYSNAYYVSGDSTADKLYGFYTENYSGTLALSNEVYKEEYVYMAKTFAGKTYYVSTKDEDTISYESGSFVVGTDAVTVGDSSKMASVYTTSGYYGNVSISATFVTAENTVYGLNAYLNDVNNYTRAYVSNNKLIIDKVVDSTSTKTEYDLPTGYQNASTEGHTLASKVEYGKLTVTLDGTAIASDVEIEVDYHSEANVGFVIGSTSATVSSLNLNGFRPLDPIDQDGFTFFGQRVDSWSYDEENGVISNQLITGVENGWKATNALYPNTEMKDLYMGANIQVSKMEGTEWKVGIMPYYKDTDNHVIVWFSQWSGAGTKIVVTAMMNGHVVGSEWRESGDVGVDMTKENYLEASIEGDKVVVYINKSSTPSMTTTVEGLSNRDMTNAFTGFQVGNGMQATFKEFTMSSEKRVYGFDEKPVINETGTRRTSGTVGENITLPIYTAENSAGDFLTPVVTVTDPSGNAVTISKNRFTPEASGTYHVKVTCVDTWGNEADPIEYDIVVTEKKGGDDSSGDTGSSQDTSKTSDTSTTDDGGKKKGCGGSIIAVSSSLGAAALLAGAIAIKKKKEEK